MSEWRTPANERRSTEDVRMTRTTKEWKGKTDDTVIPDRVKLRVFLQNNGICQCGCARKIISGESWQCDHILALVNGGDNRESNLQPLLTEHHRSKTKTDVAEKSKTYRKRLAHHGLKKQKGRTIQGSRRSGFKRKINGEVIRRKKGE
jgi:5-methylcytosine-specific restriction endonuclease McrA